VDDMQPELFPPLIIAALEAGARDAFLTPILGKKGRPGYLVTVLCDESKVMDAVRVLFSHSTTFGVRMRTDRRICLERSWRTATTPWGAVRVKIGQLNGKPTIHSPEFEDCRARAQEANVAVRAVYEAALAAAVKGELSDA
jgi:pyridinium-3,5-bisthiocarboxylic acid mononucleotide nickel chelatase